MKWSTRAFAGLIDQPAHGAVWIIECEGAPAGHAVLSVRFTMEFGGLSGYIDDLFVRPQHRRKGAASAALNALLSECQSRGCRSVHVEVGAHNHAANALYRRFGLAPGDDDRQNAAGCIAVRGLTTSEATRWPRECPPVLGSESLPMTDDERFRCVALTQYGCERFVRIHECVSRG